MAPASPKRPASERSQGSGASGEGRPTADDPEGPLQEPSERFGELFLTRMRKDDGRALIIYSQDEREQT